MRLNGLADALRSRGITVSEVPEWQGRGGELTAVRAIMCHHTAGAASGNYPYLAVVRDGRDDLPGPLAQIGLARDGTAIVIAAGRANHAGKGSGYSMPTDQANSFSIGIEAESTGTGDWTEAQRAAWPRLVAALCDAYSVPTGQVIAHREWAPGRKTDPVGIDMPTLRADVEAIRNGLPIGTPAPAQPSPDDLPLHIDGVFGPVTVRRFQRLLADVKGVYSGNIDGDWGPMSRAAFCAWMHNTPPENYRGAVELFQSHMNTWCGASLRVDGDWGPLTTKALQTALNAGAL